MNEELMKKLDELKGAVDKEGVTSAFEAFFKKGGSEEGGNKSIKETMDDICEVLEAEIINGDADEAEKKEMLKKLRKFCNTKTNIMLVGATGCGKSSTINALFACGGLPAEEENEDFLEVAKVGSKADPETKDIEKYTIGNLVLWDTPGLGDGTEIDKHHKEVIEELLQETDEEENALIDLVLVILDGSSRDLGTSYKILNEVIIPNLGEETDRILVALNQADIAMKTGRHWDYEKNEPDETLVQFLEEKVESIKSRIKEDSNLSVEPIYYCAGYKEEGGEVVHPYNLAKLLYYILNSMPSHKRVAVLESINTDAENYEYNDDEMDYGDGVSESFMDSVDDFISDGVDTGVEVGGMLFGLPGAFIGAFIGGAIGCVRSILDEIF